MASGTALAPERGAKVLIACRAIRHEAEPGPYESDSVTVRLTGPGVPDERTVTLVGVRAGTIEAITRANCQRPVGIDTWFVADDGSVIGLPTEHTGSSSSNRSVNDTTTTAGVI
jgi:alpha-D-ribose 1-methylphosphonate 5-triphosphate synthase subunit PhnH